MIKLNTPYAAGSHYYMVTYSKLKGNYRIHIDGKDSGIYFKRLPSARNYCKYLMEKESAKYASNSGQSVERL